MVDLISFDIYLLGLKDPSPAGRSEFAGAMARLTGRPAAEFLPALANRSEPLFRGISQYRARAVAGAMEEAGVRIEIRPNAGGAAAEGGERVGDQCPRCQFEVAPGGVECPRCGLVFAKWEREQVQRMQRERRLEEALTKALQVRREWDERAKRFLETHPLPADAETLFAAILNREEIPFLLLRSEEGPILLTSRRLLGKQGELSLSVPYELVADVDLGSKLVVRKDRVRLQLTLHGPLPVGDKPSKTLSWQLEKDSAFFGDVVMDWAFARKFLCGSCGAPEIDFRLDGSEVRARCMRCATDHEIDLDEALAIPLIQD